MNLAVTLFAVGGAVLLLAAISNLVLPWAAAWIVALVRRDPGGAFIPHSREVRLRMASFAYALIGLAMLVAMQPWPFRLPVDAALVAPVGGSLQERVTREVAPRIASGDMIGVVVGVIDSTGPRVFGFGRSRLGGPAPDGATIFEIGSTTEAFTGLALERLVERGTLALDRPVRELLPDSVSVPTFGSAPILVEQLATHRSSLPAAAPNRGASLLDACPPFADPWAGYTVQKLYRFLSAYDLERAPGKRVVPSQLGMGLLGHALVRLTGLDYERLIRREVADPLGLSDTHVKAAAGARGRTARGYMVGRWSYRGWRLASGAHPWRDPTLAGADGLSSTADDLLRLLGAGLGLPEGPLTPAVRSTFRPRYLARPGEAVGIGWFTRLSAGGEPSMVWQHGATGGSRSFVAAIPERGIGVVVLSNTTADVDSLGLRVARELVAHAGE
jgi:serine-type D-Ala-D-Ala carboxypeptidase/endopeptidase